MATVNPSQGDVRHFGYTSARARGKTAVVYFSAIYGVLCLWAALYLTAMELAVSPSLWLQELRLFDPASGPEAPSPGPLNARFANWFVEPGAMTRYALCEARLQDALAVSETKVIAERNLECRKVVEDALRSNPSSAPLWFNHARLLAAGGSGEAEMQRSLRLSYKYGGREGWLAERRLAFGLSRWDTLPGDLRNNVESDASLMLQSWTQLKALAQIYASDFSVRGRLSEILERQATAEQKSTFVWLVEKIMKGEVLP